MSSESEEVRGSGAGPRQNSMLHPTSGWAGLSTIYVLRGLQPAPIRAFVDTVLHTATGDLAGVLETFSWKYEKVRLVLETKLGKCDIALTPSGALRAGRLPSLGRTF